MSVTAVLLTAEVRPTAGGSGETPLQGRKSMVVTPVSTPCSGAHSARAAPSTQRRGPGEEVSFVIPASTDRVKRQATGPPSASCSPKPSEGSRARALGGTGPVGATCPRCGPRSARATLGPGWPCAGRWPKGWTQPCSQGGPGNPGGALWPTLVSAVFSPRPPWMTAPQPTGAHSACSPVGSDPWLPIFPQTAEQTQHAVYSLWPLPFILEKT